MFSRSRKILGLLCVGGLLVIGFTQALRQYTTARLQQEPLHLQVPVLRQSRSTSCGEAVIAMAHNFAHPSTPITEQEVIAYAIAHGYFTEGMPPFTSPANMVRIAQHYVGEVETGTIHTSQEAISLLIRKLRAGAPVIIDVLSDFSDPQSEAHFIIVTGISVDVTRNNTIVIHYNDPLSGTQKADDWLGDGGVWNAWLTNGDPGGAGWWMVIPLAPSA